MKTMAGDNTRPTADRVKEAVFSALMPYLPGSRVLDAFAGSTALGLEALSRGAEAAWFCEQNPGAQRICEANIKACGFANARLMKGELLTTLRRLRGEQPELRFDLIFLDPPYRSELLLRAMELIADDDWLAAEGIVIAESAASAAPVADARYRVIREKKYGDTKVRFYMLKDRNDNNDLEEG